LTIKALRLTLTAFICVAVFAAAQAQQAKKDSIYMRANYDKFEYQIPMRDGVKLFTIVYVPKDKSAKYPFLMNRTCYNASRYGEFKTGTHPSQFLVHDKYILVFQDVRGRYMSEGTFDNMRPNVPGNDLKNKQAIDESSDTWDTIDWLVKNVKGNNGNVGQFGISYPGFYTAAALPDAHPALKASSPQAPISDFFFDDFHHQGAFLESYTTAFGVFGYQKKEQTRDNWFAPEMKRFELHENDGYKFFLEQGPLKNITEKFHYDNFFWQQIDMPSGVQHVHQVAAARVGPHANRAQFVLRFGAQESHTLGSDFADRYTARCQGVANFNFYLAIGFGTLPNRLITVHRFQTPRKQTRSNGSLLTNSKKRTRGLPSHVPGSSRDAFTISRFSESGVPDLSGNVRF